MMRTWFARFCQWFLVLFGGVMVGAGLVLHGQIALVRAMTHEVHNTFFLWRAIGQATIFLQGSDVKMAMAMAEVPPEVLRESDFAAWTLVVVGALLALTGPLLPRRHLST